MLAAASDALPTDIVKMLIEKGADVNAKSPSGETAFRMAKLRGDTEITTLLRAAVTAISMRALQVYAPATERDQYERAIDRAAAWLATATPHTTEDRAFQLLGLRWSGRDRADIGKAGRALVTEQRADGGWAQLPSLSSDAYATGQALFALAESCAISVTDRAFTRGVAFLLKTQFEDGSWFVRTRALPIQPYFESGFPHGRNQFISAAATNWATLALTRVAGAQETRRAQEPPELLASCDQPWRSATIGSTPIARRAGM
jgi:hypothetical protein